MKINTSFKDSWLTFFPDSVPAVINGLPVVHTESITIVSSNLKHTNSNISTDKRKKKQLQSEAAESNVNCFREQVSYT
jgi:hypothetical protein